MRDQLRYGILPLVEEMPVALTDHIDRKPKIQLLRGKIGILHSWAAHEDETSHFENDVRVLQKSPVLALVKFPDAKMGDARSERARTQPYPTKALHLVSRQRPEEPSA